MFPAPRLLFPYICSRLQEKFFVSILICSLARFSFIVIDSHDLEKDMKAIGVNSLIALFSLTPSKIELDEHSRLAQTMTLHLSLCPLV
jgi:hypothetical protein